MVRPEPEDSELARPPNPDAAGIKKVEPGLNLLWCPGLQIVPIRNSNLTPDLVALIESPIVWTHKLDKYRITIKFTPKNSCPAHRS